MVVAAGYEDYLQDKFPNYYAGLEDLKQVPGVLPDSTTPPRNSSVKSHSDQP
ncbi:MAG: hypothetical protein Ct9H300mP7_4220 [Verrucomicrobiota bacterium]|nr:MAG: hypothetical protein Ct9H300mP7_4220 [Verrucomicrobiota bacterium]